MNDNIKSTIELSIFNVSQHADRDELDSQLAAAVLLFEIVKSDGRIDRVEIAAVMNVLREQFSLEGEQLGHLMEMISDDGKNQSQLELFALQLREHWSRPERLNLLDNFWVIAIADQVIDDREDELIQRIALLLDLDEIEITEARNNARVKLQKSSKRS